MSTLTRALAKVFLKSLNGYNCLYDQVSRAVDPHAPGLVKSHPKLREKLDEFFITLYSDWKFYSSDLNMSNEDFNKVGGDTGQPVIEHNDEWWSNMQQKYYDLCDKSDDVLESQVVAIETTKGASKESTETKVLDLEIKKKEDHEKKLSELLLTQIEAETEAIKLAVNKLDADVKGITVGTLALNKARSLKISVRELCDRLNIGLQTQVLQCLPLLQNDEAELKNTLHIQFLTQNRAKLRSILEEVEEKTEMKRNASPSTGAVVRSKAEQTYLKKCDPPKFDGDEVKFPDFKRK